MGGRVKSEQDFLTHLEEGAAVQRGPRIIGQPSGWNPHSGASPLRLPSCCLPELP